MYRLLTDRELSNFRSFTNAIPLTEFGPKGAFDSAIPRRPAMTSRMTI